MTSRPSRRARRRRSAPAPSLPRPVAGEGGRPIEAAREREPRERESREPRDPRIQVHHVTTDYRHVRTDLLMVAGVSAVAFAFVVLMKFVV